MRISRLLIFVIAAAMLPCGKCFAAEPAVSREYISVKKGEVKTEEERLRVDYTDLPMAARGYLRISFIDGAENIIGEYEMEIYSGDLPQNEMNLKSEALRGCEFIKIELVGPEYEHVCIKIPLKI